MPPKRVYQYTPTAGVRADFKRLMNDFIGAKTVRYEKFSEIWREKKFSYLCAGRDSEREGREFVERALLIALEFFLPPYQFQVRVGGLYLLYGIFMTQPIVPKVKIRLTCSQWNDTMQFHQDASQQNHLDVVYIFSRMLMEHAFHFCFTPHEMNEKTINSEKEDNEINLADEMKEERREINQLFNYESVEQMSYLMDYYRQMKVTLAGPKANKPDKSLDVVHSSLVEDVVKMLQSFKESVGKIYKHGSAEAADETTNEAGGSKPEQTILSKRQAIKARSFAGPADGSGSPKKTVGTEDISMETQGGMNTQSSPAKTKNSQIHSQCQPESDQEDALEEFVSPLSRRKKSGHHGRKSLEESPTQPKVINIATGTSMEGENSSESVLPSSNSHLKKSSCINTESGNEIEMTYVKSVKVLSKKGEDLTAKLEEIARGQTASQNNRGRKRRESQENVLAVRKSPRKESSKRSQDRSTELDPISPASPNKDCRVDETVKRGRGRRKVFISKNVAVLPDGSGGKEDEKEQENVSTVRKCQREIDSDILCNDLTQRPQGDEKSQSSGVNETVKKSGRKRGAVPVRSTEVGVSARPRRERNCTMEKKRKKGLSCKEKKSTHSQKERDVSRDDSQIEFDVSKCDSQKEHESRDNSPVLKKKRNHIQSSVNRRLQSKANEQSESETPFSSSPNPVEDELEHRNVQSKKQPADRKRMSLRQRSGLKPPVKYTTKASARTKLSTPPDEDSTEKEKGQRLETASERPEVEKNKKRNVRVLSFSPPKGRPPKQADEDVIELESPHKSLNNSTNFEVVGKSSKEKPVFVVPQKVSSLVNNNYSIDRNKGKKNSSPEVVAESLQTQTSQTISQTRKTRSESEQQERQQGQSGELEQQSGRKRSMSVRKHITVLSSSSEEENFSLVNHSKAPKESAGVFENVLKSKANTPKTMVKNHFLKSPSDKTHGSYFDISKAPLSKVIGGNRETGLEKDKKPVKIIKIVTKGISEAKEVLKALEKQKASGKKLLEDLPSQCVQAITVGGASKVVKNIGKITSTASATATSSPKSAVSLEGTSKFTSPCHSGKSKSKSGIVDEKSKNKSVTEGDGSLQSTSGKGHGSFRYFSI